MSGDEQATERRPTIAFLGTGLMGAPMARRLLQAGFSVTVWNRDGGKAQPLAGDGATVAGRAADAARGARVVFTMLTDGAAVADVLFTQGVAGVLDAGATVIDMSSIAPPFAREHSARLSVRDIRHIGVGTRFVPADTLRSNGP